MNEQIRKETTRLEIEIVSIVEEVQCSKVGS